ncbi:HNH endonuclease signature motif containing protein [Arthrobacter sp. zg-Y1171]|uniref:HNH endonuclease n=1 Tax=Arthrobacter sp. zg-Y1171 TaxID=2964610 RepID=UPI002105B412|nr:HNH endonuclease signature motif containing protein [Arthrobacter sp. zg-Y1171]MCQ1995346.1 HNH endonuclease [Arthrobacter sp. zg-Y1171]UWX80616.1 HNH endonuclease [Arthrobacter sp. zg-Y1171]
MFESNRDYPPPVHGVEPCFGTLAGQHCGSNGPASATPLSSRERPGPATLSEAYCGNEPSSPQVATWITELSSGRVLEEIASDTDACLISRLRVLEELKAAAAAAQVRVAAAFDASVRAAHARSGVPLEQQGRGVAAQIALARRESPARGGRILGFSKALAHEMPCTLRALSEGRLNEWRATLLVRETACLSVSDRRLVDREVAGDPAGLEGLGGGRLIGRIRKLTYRIDQEALVRRAAKAQTDRHVSCRPAPDTMTYLTGLLPVAQGVAVFAALSREADYLRARGDSRGRGQIMADTMVERITGLAQADRVPLEVQLVMTDRTLLAGSNEPAYLSGYGAVPAMWARDAVRKAATGRAGGGLAASGSAGGERSGSASTPKAGRKDPASRHEESASPDLWLRRLYTAPTSGELIAMDSKARYVPDSLARFISARDQTCRTPWCNAPIRHRDHIRPHRIGGSTNAENLQGLCEACNQAKEAPGWRARSVGSPGRHTVEITTPTGYSYQSTAPPLPGD